MGDMALRWGRSGVRVHVVSRHGLLPLPHASGAGRAAPGAEIDDSVAELTLGEARRLVFAQIRAAGGDWRAPSTACVRSPPSSGAAWTTPHAPLSCAVPARRWDRVRHRVDPALRSVARPACADGSMRVHTGAVVSASRRPRRGLRVRLSDGTVVDAVAGAQLHRHLRPGPARRGPAGPEPAGAGLAPLGLARPRLRDRLATAGCSRPTAAAAAVWAIGPLRRGELWESTAIPEIRAQAADVAAARRRRPAERRTCAAARATRTACRCRRARRRAGATSTALGRILRVQSGADERSPKQCASTPTSRSGTPRWRCSAPSGAPTSTSTRRWPRRSAPPPRADERERRFVDVVDRAGAPSRVPASAAALLAYIQTYPEDALAVSAAVPTIAFAGATEMPAETWALVDGLAPAYGDNWWYRGLLAFFRQEQERFDEAAELADLALAVEPAAGHAVHARDARLLRDRRSPRRAALARLAGSRRAAPRPSTSRTSPGTPRCTNSRSATTGPPAERFAAQLRAADGHRRPGAGRLGRAAVARRDASAWTAVDVAAVLAVVPPRLLTAPPTPFVALHAAFALPRPATAPDWPVAPRTRSAATVFRSRRPSRRCATR